MARDKDELMRTTLSEDFYAEHGSGIVERLDEIIADEVALVNNNWKLWRVPWDAEVRLPRMDPNIKEIAEQKAEEFIEEFKNSKREARIQVTQKTNGNMDRHPYNQERRVAT